MGRPDPELEAFIRQLVRDELFKKNELGTQKIFGSWSRKKLGDVVGDALMHSPIVLVDGRGITHISGHKPGWR